MFFQKKAGDEWLIVGLGNPGSKYWNTRHNVGYAALDALAEDLHISVSRVKFQGMYGQGTMGGQKVVLLKPTTYMNLSGQCVQPLLAWHRIKPGAMVVVHDELDIPPGALRFKFGGGNAGHNGLKSITEQMGTPNFYRLRIGIGRPPQRGDVTSWVLGRPFGEDRERWEEALDAGVTVLEAFANRGLERAVRTANEETKRILPPA